MSTRLEQYRWNQLTAAEQSAVLQRPAVKANAEITAQAGAIIARVQTGGDAALRELAPDSGPGRCAAECRCKPYNDCS